MSLLKVPESNRSGTAPPRRRSGEMLSPRRRTGPGTATSVRIARDAQSRCTSTSCIPPTPCIVQYCIARASHGVRTRLQLDAAPDD